MTDPHQPPLLAFKGVWKRLCRDPRLFLRNAIADVWQDLTLPDAPPTLRPGEFWALQDIHLAVYPGEVLGIIGFNGAGKSTLMNLASRVWRPTSGQVESSSPRIRLLDPGAGLNDVQTGRENAYNRLVMGGLPPAIASDRVDAVARFAAIGDAFESPVGTYSLGMRLRLGYALVAQEEPDLFLVDEALGGGDVRFQARFLDSIHAYLDRGGAMLLCSHDLPLVQALAKRTLLLDAGRVIAEGPAGEVIQRYLDLAGERTSRTATPGPTPPPARTEASPGPVADSDVRLTTVDYTSPLKPGEPWELKVTCISTQDEGEVVIGIEISPHDFRPLGLSWSGPDSERLHVRAGTNGWRCRIDQFPLLPGIYQLRLAIARRSNLAVLTSLGYEDSLPLELKVEGLADAGHNAARAAGAHVHLATHWAIVP